MFNRRLIPFLLLFASSFLPSPAAAQELLTADDLATLSLAELMGVKITIASRKAVTQRESPGIVSVVTEEEIQNSGASDLIDVLRLVPGIEMAHDTWGVTGISMRGNIGYIGRVLLMIDGQETNDLHYSCAFVGNHYPVSNIKRIEIIRGPGSSIYGGFAELGVINVTTKTGADLKGISISADYGQMSGDVSHSNVTISAGNMIGDFEYSLHGFYGRGNRSDRDNTDAYGSSYNMSDQARLNPAMINAAASYKDLGVRIVYDNYQTTTRDWFGENVAKDYEVTYKTIFGEVKYDWQVSDRLTLTPKYNLMHNTPWSSMDEGVEDDTTFYQLEKQTLRNRIGLLGSFDLNEDASIIAGGEYCRDDATNNLGESFWNGKPEINYHNLSGFAQGIISSDLVDVTLGGRVDKHSDYGAAFSPRVGLTRVLEKWHFKLLYSQAFRSPAIDEIHFNVIGDSTKTKPDIEPEKAKVVEFEVGYLLSRDMSISANVYFASVDNTIVYSYGEDFIGYENQGVSGSKGFEIEFRLRKDWGYATLNYSYYNAKGINEVDYYAAGDRDEVVLGSSPHKFAANSSFRLHKGLSVNPSLVVLGEKYAYNRYDESTGGMALSAQDPVALANLYLNCREFFAEGLSLGLGVYNLFDAEYDFVQPYNGWHAPLPGRSRRMVAKLSYDIGI